MPSDWADVATLMRDLGAVRVAAFGVHATDADYIAIEDAIAKATQAVVVTLDDPRNRTAVSDARQAIATARERVASLATEIERGRRAREHATELGVKPRPRREGDG